MLSPSPTFRKWKVGSYVPISGTSSPRDALVSTLPPVMRLSLCHRPFLSHTAHRHPPPALQSELRRVDSAPLLTRTLEYEIPELRDSCAVAQRSASYPGRTRADKERSNRTVSEARQALIEQPLWLGEGIGGEGVEDLKKRYLCREVAKYLKKTEGFEGQYWKDNRLIIRGGFQLFEGRAIMSQPVSSVKVLLAGENRR